MASSKEIKLFSLLDDVEEDEDITFTPDPQQVTTITSEELHEMPIHGLFIQNPKEKYIIVALETLDHQIDFNMLTITQKPTAD
jgi:hypothetical protein